MKYLLFVAFVASTFFLSAPLDVRAASEPASQAALNTININTAGAAELQRLPGIGQVTAQAIVEYRTAEGNFAAPEDLLKVKGVGAKTLEKIRSQIDVK